MTSTFGLRLGACALAFVSCASSERPTEEGVAAGDPTAPADAFSATVQRVVDGDTFVAERDGRVVRVRLIGIDAPESVQPEAPVECFGPNSAAGLRALLPGGTKLRAQFQGEQHRDRFGRDLWDVWLSDERFLQGVLVRNGYARARVYRPHVRYAKVLAKAEESARAGVRGLHAACP